MQALPGTIVEIPRMRIARLACALALVAPPLLAQSARSFDVSKVAEGVYVFIQREPLASPIDGNTTVIINDADVVVVDTRITPAAAREVIAEIRKLTRHPVRYVVNTHWHSDHHYGNDAFRTAYPGVEFIGHAMTRADILTQDTDSILRRNVDSTYPRAIADRKRFLATNTAPDGSALRPELRAFYERQIPGMEYAMEQIRNLRILPPTLTITDGMRLERGARVIDIRFLGRANTRGDLIVHLPRERIVITGDILVAPVPFSFGSYLGDWTGTLDAIDRLPVDIIIPGHGPVQRDRVYLRQVRTLIDSMSTQVKRAVAEGKDLAGVRQSLALDSLMRAFTKGDYLVERAFRGFFVLPASERAFLEARGELKDR